MQECKLFNADKISYMGDEPIESTFVSAYELELLLKELKEDYPDTPLHEIDVRTSGDERSILVTGLTYNVDGSEPLIIIHTEKIE